MKDKKLITVIGARPQFIKAAPLSRKFSAPHSQIREILVHTGQHFGQDMSEIFFQQLEIPSPAYNLNINSVGHGAMTGRMLEALEQVLLTENPGAVLVYGDTNSTLAGALAASKLNIPVVHVESGLRSYLRTMPEEINRVLVDRISALLFCPNQGAIENLAKEGIVDGPNQKIVQSGDVMFDSYLHCSSKISGMTTLPPNVTNFVFVTIHRQENTDSQDRLEKIIEELNTLHKSIPVIAALHPRTLKKLETLSIRPAFYVIPPQGYLETLGHLRSCQFVITDSGGLQKEAFFAKKLCFIARPNTEWVELVQCGVALIANLDLSSCLKQYRAKNHLVNFDHNFFGDGHSADIIYDAVHSLLS